MACWPRCTPVAGSMPCRSASRPTAPGWPFPSTWSSPSLRRSCSGQRNLDDDPRAALLCDHWDPVDWSRLWWVRASMTEDRRRAGGDERSARCWAASTRQYQEPAVRRPVGLRDHRAVRLVGCDATGRHLSRRPSCHASTVGRRTPRDRTRGVPRVRSGHAITCPLERLSAVTPPSGRLVPREPVGAVGVHPGRELGVEDELARRLNSEK